MTREWRPEIIYRGEGPCRPWGGAAVCGPRELAGPGLVVAGQKEKAAGLGLCRVLGLGWILVGKLAGLLVGLVGFRSRWGPHKIVSI